MENKTVLNRLKSLREAMQKEKIDYYMIPTADFHNSEYVNDYFKVRQFFSGFTGSNGTLVVWQDGAGLWTDGRYFIQAMQELSGTSVTLYKMLNEGVPTIEEFLQKEMKEGQTLGFDGRVIPATEGKKLENILAKKNVQISITKDLSENIWTDRPAFPAGRINVLPDDITGKSVEEKLEEVRKRIRKAGADGLLLTKLDDIMWLFNIRGCDVECNPVAMSYAYIDENEAVLFIQKHVVDKETDAYFKRHGICVEEYGSVTEFIRKLPGDLDIFVDPRYCSYHFYKLLEKKQKVVEGKNPTEQLKAVKNPTELAHMKEVYLHDSVAVTKFIYWLKTHVGKEKITEITAADYLEGLRRQIPGFLDLSFPTIAGYKENAAMMHYEATKESAAVLGKEGMLLVDSGGQYMGGTTDVTRTIVLGPISEEIRKHYTKVAAAMLQLSHAHWLYGCTGRNLDILARQPLWDLSIDYQCGTGHGVGYILNVHEGPQSMRWRFNGMEEAVLEEGMDITNEPGVYIAGSHGIRIENVMVAKNDIKNEYGQFMHFETLTWVPLDREGIDIRYLNDTQREMLNAYQAEVYERVSPYLTKEEREWLYRETAQI